MPNFTALLPTYADVLLTCGLQFQPGQELFLSCEVGHQELASLIRERAYKMGARAVHTSAIDSLEEAMVIKHAPLASVSGYLQPRREWFGRLLSSGSPLLGLRGLQFPALMPEVARHAPERFAQISGMINEIRKPWSDYGVNGSLNPWCLAGAATPGWAEVVFPDKGEEALGLLWAELFRHTFADQPNPIEANQSWLKVRERWGELLNGARIKTLHVTGHGNDFTIGIHEKARWEGGAWRTKDGRVFEANMGGKEKFTTPDCRTTRGQFAATMPFRLHSGALIRGLKMTFGDDGRITTFSADEGADAFGKWIDLDANGRRVGEFAIVDMRTPIAESGIYFDSTLQDENARGHIAVGNGYTKCIEGGDTMSPEEREAHGISHSRIHTDMMYSGPETRITATTYDNRNIVVVEDGRMADWLPLEAAA